MIVPYFDIPDDVIVKLWKETLVDNADFSTDYFSTADQVENEQLFAATGIKRRRIDGELVYEFEDENHYAIILLKYS